MKSIFIISLTILASTTMAYDKQCVSKYLADTYEEKRVFHSLVQDIVLTKSKRFSHIGAVNKELQSQLAYRQKLRLDFINENFPDEIKKTYLKTKDIKANWDKSYDEAFLKPLKNKILTSKISVLQKQNNEHKDWPEFRAHFRSKIFPVKRYKKLQSKLFKNLAMSKEGLKACF